MRAGPSAFGVHAPRTAPAMIRVSLATRSDASGSPLSLVTEVDFDTAAITAVPALRVWAAAAVGAPEATITAMVVWHGADDEEELTNPRHVRDRIKEGCTIVVELAAPAATPLWMDPATDGDEAAGRQRFFIGMRLTLDLLPEMYRELWCVSFKQHYGQDWTPACGAAYIDGGLLPMDGAVPDDLQALPAEEIPGLFYPRRGKAYVEYEQADLTAWLRAGDVVRFEPNHYLVVARDPINPVPAAGLSPARVSGPR